MLLSYVLRLVPSALAEGRLAGTVQAVESGDTTAFRSVDELVAALVPGREPAGDPVIDLRDVSRRPSADRTE